MRDLIGDKHWLSDGHHKEYLLIDLLQRHLPTGVMASRGFVISATNAKAISREQDVLLVETLHEAPLFNQGGLVVVFPRQVLAAISVKTMMSSKMLRDTIRGLSSVRAVAAEDADVGSIWYGGYFFERSNETRDRLTKLQAAVASSIREDFCSPPGGAAGVAPIVCATPELALRVDQGLEPEKSGARIRGLNCTGLGTALILADILDHLAVARNTPNSDFADFADIVACEQTTDLWVEI